MVPADDMKRAKKFYTELFGWKIEKMPGPMEYYGIETTDEDGKKGLAAGLEKEKTRQMQLSIILMFRQLMNILPKLKNSAAK